MKKNLTLLVVLVFIICSNSYSQWVKLNSGTSANLFWLSFPTNDTGYVMSDAGGLYKTKDVGQTWQYLNSTPNSAMDFATVDTGLGCNNTDIYKTTNGGITWISVYHDPTLYLSGVFLLDHKNFFVFGFTGYPDSAILLKSTDGGNSWTSSRFVVCGVPIGLSFATQNIGYLGGTGCVLKTIDGGLTWNISYHDSTNTLNGIYFFSKDTGFAFSIAGSIFRTGDGGQTWNNANTFGNNNPLYNMKLVNQNIGYVVGGDGINTGDILKTTDGGFNWNLDTSFSESFADVAFTKDLQVFVSGLGGIILRFDAQPNGINEIENNKHALSIYPNPNNGTFTINFKQATKNIKVEVFTMLGEKIFSKIVAPAPLSFGEGLGVRPPAGVYLLKVSDGERQYFEKVVVE